MDFQHRISPSQIINMVNKKQKSIFFLWRKVAFLQSCISFKLLISDFVQWNYFNPFRIVLKSPRCTLLIVWHWMYVFVLWWGEMSWFTCQLQTIPDMLTTASVHYCMPKMLLTLCSSAPISHTLVFLSHHGVCAHHRLHSHCVQAPYYLLVL